MLPWILIAGFGVLLALLCLASMCVELRRGQIRGTYFGAILVGVVSLLCYALLSNVFEGVVPRAVEFAVLLPAVAAIVLLVTHRHHPV